MGEKSEKENPKNDYDGAWKEILDTYLESFVALCFPDIIGALDFSIPPKPLEQELMKLFPSRKASPMRVDKLYEFVDAQGDKKLFLLHMELQASRDPWFSQRLFRYHFRISERWHLPLTTLAILADASPNWRPTTYLREFLGTQLNFQFPTCKLLDLEQEGKLDGTKSPVRMLIAAHLQSLRTRNQPEARLAARLAMAKTLFRKGWSGDEIRKIFRFLEWLMILPESLEIDFQQQLDDHINEEKTMSYVCSYERRGLARGIEEGMEKGIEHGQIAQARDDILDAIKIRFGEVPQGIRDRVLSENNVSVLKTLLRKAIIVEKLESF